MYYPSVTQDNNTIQNASLTTDVLQVAYSTVVCKLMPQDSLIVMKVCAYVTSYGEEELRLQIGMKLLIS